MAYIDINDVSGSGAGDATAANQLIEIALLTSIDSKIPSGLTVTSSRLLVDGSGVTQPISAASLPLPTGAATSANQTTEITSLQLLDDVPSAQNAAFSKGNPIMGQLDDTSTVVATEDNVSVARITAQRALHTNLRNNAGTEIATSANPVRIDPTGTTAQPITDNGGSLTVDTPQLPAALVGSRLDTNNGAWLGSTAPTVGQKTSANSIPVVLSSDQPNITVNTTTPSFTNKIRVEPTTTTIALAAGYTTIYTYTGSGLFIGWGGEFSANRYTIKLVIDGTETVLESDSVTLNALAATTSTTARYQAGTGLVLAASNIDISFRYPIKFSTSIVISAKITTGAAMNFNQGIMYIEKDT